MKIAILSDIHGNSVALQAVLSQVKQLGVQRLFVLGDMVGYYYHPKQVLKMLSAFDTTMVQGNHEVMLDEAQKDPAKATMIKGKYGSGISVALEELSREEVDMLAHLPQKRTVDIDGVTFLLCHGTPWDYNQYVYPDAPKEMLERCASQGVDVVLQGHTHYPLEYKGVGGLLLNPGSVGQARDIGRRASWILFDTSNRKPEFVRTPFDILGVMDEARAKDPGVPYLAEVLERSKV